MVWCKGALLEKENTSPILEEVIKASSETPDGMYVYEPGALKSLQERAEKMTSGQELFNFLSDIIKFGSFLATQRNSPEAAEALFEMIAVLAEHMDKLALAEGQRGEQKSKEIRTRLSEERRSLFIERSPSKGLMPGKGGVSIRKFQPMEE